MVDAQPLTIAHVTATFPPYLGGAGTAAWETTRALAARGHEVHVFTAERTGAPHDPAGVEVHRLKPLVAVGNAPLLPGLARIGAFDIVHLHHPFIFGTEPIVLRRRRRGRLFVSYHNLLIGEGLRHSLFTAWEQTVGRMLVNRADRVCVVSREHARTVPYLASLERRRPEQILVLPNGVALETFSPDGEHCSRAELGVPEDALLLAFVAALDQAHFFKRLDVAIDALAVDGAREAHLFVVGDGELAGGYRERAEHLGVASRVHFAGAVAHDRLPHLLRACDALVLPSDLESFGIALLEAMACGLPTISTGPPGVLTFVRPGETGLVVPRGDAAAVARAIGALRDAGPAGRAVMGAVGRRVAEAGYGWDALAERLEHAYLETLPTVRPVAVL